MDKDQTSSAAEELTEAQKRDNVARLAFANSQDKLDEFVRIAVIRSRRTGG